MPGSFEKLWIITLNPHNNPRSASSYEIYLTSSSSITEAEFEALILILASYWDLCVCLCL